MPGRKFAPNLGAARSGMLVKSLQSSNNSRISHQRPNIVQKRTRIIGSEDGDIEVPKSPPLLPNVQSCIQAHVNQPLDLNNESSVCSSVLNEPLDQTGESLTKSPKLQTHSETEGNSWKNPMPSPPNISRTSCTTNKQDTVEQKALGKTSWVRKKVAPKVSTAGRNRKQNKSNACQPKDKEISSRNTEENVHVQELVTLQETDDTRADLPSLHEHLVDENQPVSDLSQSLTISHVVEVLDIFPLNDVHCTETSQSEVNEIHEPSNCTTTSQDVTDDIHDDNIASTTSGVHEEEEEEVDSRSVRSSSVSSCSSRNDEEPHRKRKRGSSSSESTPSKSRKKGSPSETKRSKANLFREAPDRSKMTMQDLIYYNPSANPMSSTEKGKSMSKSSSSQEGSSTEKGKSMSLSSSSQEGRSNPDSETSVEEKNHLENDKSEAENEEEGRIVPQLKIGADGTIVIDEQSMIVESSFQQKNEFEETVTEDTEYTTSTSFRNKHKIKKWTKEETTDFYKALSQVGTDFTMMTLILPKRSRKELKNKFKKEEKSNPVKISAALTKLCSVSSTSSSSSQRTSACISSSQASS